MKSNLKFACAFLIGGLTMSFLGLLLGVLVAWLGYYPIIEYLDAYFSKCDSMEFYSLNFFSSCLISWVSFLGILITLVGIRFGYIIIDWLLHGKLNNEASLKYIRNGYITALIFLGTIFLFYIYTGKTNFFSLNHPFFIDLVVVLILTFGVFKKSRISAILLLIYFILSAIFLFDLKSLTPIFGIFTIIYALVFIYFFVQAIRGTLSYHKKI